jgi:hypothetical protein
MKTHLQVSSTGEILGVHRAVVRSATLITEHGTEVVEAELDPTQQSSGLRELKAKYVWDRERRRLEKR